MLCRDSINFRVLRLFVISAAGAVWLWAFSNPGFRDAEGFLDARFCLPLAAGMGLLAVGCGLSGPWRKSALCFALGLVGQAVGLQLIEAGPRIRYQHYEAWSSLTDGENLLFVTFLMCQAVIVAAGLKSRWGEVQRGFLPQGNVLRYVGIVLLAIPFSAALSRDVGFYLREILFASLIQLVNLGNVVLLAESLPEDLLTALESRIGRFRPANDRWFAKLRARVDLLVLSAALAATVLALSLNWLVYENHPHVPDEVIYLFHARYFAAGKLGIAAPPVPEAFSLYMIPHASDPWYSIFPPGWPAILALGVLVKAPWIVNPLLSGVTVYLIYLFLHEVYDHRTARLGGLLASVSPWFVYMGMSFMSHMFTLTSALGAAVALLFARKSERVSLALISGCLAGLVSLARPLDGLIVALLLGSWAVGVFGHPMRRWFVAAYAFGLLCVGGTTFFYNEQLTGDATLSPLTAYYETYFGPKVNALGFGPERGLGWAIDAYPGHSLSEAFINASLNLFSVNTELLGWSTGSLVFIGLLLFSNKVARGDYLMIVIIATVAGAYSLYWFSGGPDFGARYWFLMIVPCLALVARSVLVLPNIAGTIAVLCLSIFAMVNYFPWRALDKYHHYLGMRPDVHQLSIENNFQSSIVLVRGNSFPDYASAWVYNPLDVRSGSTVYAWDRDRDVRQRLLETYPDKEVWLINGPSITGNKFEVALGPLNGGSLPSENGGVK